MSTYYLKHVPPNPTLEYANNIVLPPGTTEIVSTGGGSTIDVGKWLAKKYDLEHIVIPTTGGTGSEVTRYAVLSVDGEKRTFTDNRHLPDGYILDPRLSITLPKEQTISTGLDALSQALESLWSKHATLESHSYATVAMELVLKNIKTCVKNPNDLRARMDMLIAANMSGRAIDISPTNICHAISYPLTDWYGIPHGMACGMSLGYFAEKAGFPIAKFIKPLIKKYKIDKKKVAAHAIKNEKVNGYPLPVTELDIYKSLI